MAHRLIESVPCTRGDEPESRGDLGGFEVVFPARAGMNRWRPTFAGSIRVSTVAPRQTSKGACRENLPTTETFDRLPAARLLVRADLGRLRRTFRRMHHRRLPGLARPTVRVLLRGQKVLGVSRRKE